MKQWDNWREFWRELWAVSFNGVYSGEMVVLKVKNGELDGFGWRSPRLLLNMKNLR
jgi:hypothetical protein